MKTTLMVLGLSISLLSGCSTTQPCEDILEVKQQAMQCERLKRVMQDPSNPTQRLVAQERFKAECENLRYYRDDYDTICKGNQRPIGDKPLLKSKDSKQK